MLTLASPKTTRNFRAIFALAGILAALGLACRRGGSSQNPCSRSDDAQCEFERAIAQAKAQEAEKQAQARREREQTQLRGWAFADQLLLELSQTLADGMDAAVVHTRTENRCRFEVGVTRRADQSWVCPLDFPLQLDGAEFLLEYSPDGVLSLASDQLDATQSASLLEEAIKRWRPRCQGQQFVQVEGGTHHKIYRCALPEGPLLVLGRFDRDLAADRWQLSFAMVAVG